MNYADSLKRPLDIAVAGTALIVFSPILLICVVAIRTNSSGPALFRQQRVGLNERIFTCYKLRTMFSGTAQAPSHEASASAVTSVGRVLRRRKLDELPQLWNVLRGEMSLVGPRPCLPSQRALIEARRARGVYAIRPGITGISQAAGIDMSNPRRLAAADATYLDRITLVTDLWVIGMTLRGWLSGRGRRNR